MGLSPRTLARGKPGKYFKLEKGKGRHIGTTELIMTGTLVLCHSRRGTGIIQRGRPGKRLVAEERPVLGDRQKHPRWHEISQKFTNSTYGSTDSSGGQLKAAMNSSGEQRSEKERGEGFTPRTKPIAQEKKKYLRGARNLHPGDNRH